MSSERDRIREALQHVQEAREALAAAIGNLSGAESSLQAADAALEQRAPDVQRLLGNVICIDAGHGGHDSGAVSPDGTVSEKNLVLPYAEALGAELGRRGARVIQTRTEDVFVPLGERAKIANQAGADCLLSIHANAAASGLPAGAWVIHDDMTGAGPKGGIELAREIFRALDRAGFADADPEVEVFPDRSPWVGGRNLAVISQTRMPAILVELGFLTSDDDRARMLDPTARARAVREIAEGTEVWLLG